MTTVGVTGGTGAMGRAVREVAAARDNLDIGLVVTRSPSDVAVDGADVVTPEELEGSLGDVDVLVDFSVPEGTLAILPAARDAGVGVVSGTTGFDQGQLDRVKSTAETIPILVAPNFSRGVYVLQNALAATVEHLPEFDIEMTESHHNRKRDAPSGTAYRLLETIQESRPESTLVHGRSGQSPRSKEEIGVHAIRAGSITGEHEVILAGAHEELRLTHRAESRQVFAAGALDAANWIDDKPPGWYQFGDVVET